MSILSKKNNALAKVAKIASFKTRLMIGNGLIMSMLTYAIQIYGACSSYLIHMLQVQQNAAARHITQLPWMTPTSTLLKQCKWITAKIPGYFVLNVASIEVMRNIYFKICCFYYLDILLLNI